MSETTPLYLVHLLGFAGFLWLGLYALARGDGGRISTVTGLAALFTACFFFAGGVLIALHELPWAPAVARATWWASVVPIALWLQLSLLLNPHAAAARWREPALWAAYGAAALLIVLGTATSLIRDYDAGPATAGAGYVLYVAYLVTCTGFALVNFAQMQAPRDRLVHLPWAPLPGADEDGDAGAAGAAVTDGPPSTGRSGETRGTQVRLLIAGAVCFLLGAGYLAVKMLLHRPWIELPAYSVLLAGLGAVGATVTLHGALLLGKNLRRDALYSMAGLVVLLALYLATAVVLVGYDDLRHRLFFLLLAALITAVHTLHDAGRDWLDAAFFPPVVRQERAAARAYATALASGPVGPHPDLATTKAFDDAVRRALTHLMDPTKLATSPLLHLAVVAQGVAEQGSADNRLTRAAILKEILLDLLDGLRPHDSPGRVTADAWRYYNCLYYPYVRGVSRRRAPSVLRHLAERRVREGGPRSDLEQVLEWLLQVDEDTFYKWQRRGSDTIAAVLREREAAAGGVVPSVERGPASAESTGLGQSIPVLEQDVRPRRTAIERHP